MLTTMTSSLVGSFRTGMVSPQEMIGEEEMAGDEGDIQDSDDSTRPTPKAANI